MSGERGPFNVEARIHAGVVAAVCFYCAEPLRHEGARGWVHMDGQVYRTRREWGCPRIGHHDTLIAGTECGLCGLEAVEIVLDDHCARPWFLSDAEREAARG